MRNVREECLQYIRIGIKEADRGPHQQHGKLQEVDKHVRAAESSIQKALDVVRSLHAQTGDPIAEGVEELTAAKVSLKNARDAFAEVE